MENDPRGRAPIIKDPEVVKEILVNISKGLSNVDSCQLAGITASSFYNIQARARKAKEDVSSVPNGQMYLDFFDALKRAKIKRKQTRIVKIQTSDQWQAQAWLLERQNPDEFGKKERVEHSGSIEKTDFSGLDFRELYKLKYGVYPED